jgi:hypothetical protein
MACVRGATYRSPRTPSCQPCLRCAWEERARGGRFVNSEDRVVGELIVRWWWAVCVRVPRLDESVVCVGFSSLPRLRLLRWPGWSAMAGVLVLGRASALGVDFKLVQLWDPGTVRPCRGLSISYLCSSGPVYLCASRESIMALCLGILCGPADRGQSDGHSKSRQLSSERDGHGSFETISRLST